MYKLVRGTYINRYGYLIIHTLIMTMVRSTDSIIYFNNKKTKFFQHFLFVSRHKFVEFDNIRILVIVFAQSIFLRFSKDLHSRIKWNSHQFDHYCRVYIHSNLSLIDFPCHLSVSTVKWWFAVRNFTNIFLVLGDNVFK